MLVEVKAGGVELRSTGIYKQDSNGERQVDRQVKFQYSCLKARLQQANLVVDVKNCFVLADCRIGDQEQRLYDHPVFDCTGNPPTDAVVVESHENFRSPRASHQALEHHRFERVTDVAFAFGFRNLSHFSRSFKAMHGVSPQQLLRRR